MRLARAVLLTLCLVPSVGAAQEIVSAEYARPTNSYGHGALKDGEYEALVVTLSDGTRREFHMRNGVFEDTAPRLHDFDKDGVPEIVTVFSTNVGGAMIQIWRNQGTQVLPAGNSKPIGQRHRWLSIAGIADFDGNGIDEIAYIDRPHLAKTLVLMSVELSDGKAAFTKIADAPDLTNHHLGSPDIEGGIRECANAAPVVVTSDGNWSKIIETRLENGELVGKAVGSYEGPQSLEQITNCQ